MGRLIAIEGVDGVGKGTQAALLVDWLREQGLTTALISFPRYAETFYGKLVGRYLNGDFGPAQPLLGALLFAGDRLESRDHLIHQLRDHEVVVLDRYVASNLAHQLAWLPQEAHAEFQEMLLQIEFSINLLPVPELTLLLDAPLDCCLARVAQKKKRVYTDKAADIHEADRAYLERVQRLYRELSWQVKWPLRDWFRVDEPGDVQAVAAEIQSRVRTYFPALFRKHQESHAPPTRPHDTP